MQGMNRDAKEEREKGGKKDNKNYYLIKKDNRKMNAVIEISDAIDRKICDVRPVARIAKRCGHGSGVSDVIEGLVTS